MNPDNAENPNIFPQIYTGIPISERSARNLTDRFALAWIFFSVLAGGLLMLDVNLSTTLLSVFSVMLGGIWWALSHYKPQTAR